MNVKNVCLFTKRRVQQASCLIGIAIAVLSQTATAACTYTVDSEWATGFTATITVKNDTGALLNNWNINWQYSANRMTGGWNANISGSNPYTASNLSWNGNVAVGQSVSFGFQGTKNGGSIERPAVTGAACNGGATSAISSSRSSSVSSSSRSSSFLSSSRSSIFSSSSFTSSSSRSSLSSAISSSSRSSSSSSSTRSSFSSVGSESLVLAINSGGGKVTYAGVEYQADKFNSGGTSRSTTDTIRGVVDGALFQDELYGTYGYEIPVTNATYSIDLHFAETYHETSGRRSFNVVVEGKKEMSEVDIFSLIGADAAYSYRVNNVVVSDGKLNINLETLVDNATLSGFAVYSTSGKLVEPTPPTPPTPGANKENEGADCILGSTPAATSNAKLPDPFKKYDGSRLTSKADWRCRRQEILKQVEASIYGVKPPKPETVTGSVSTSQITVNVEHLGKRASFTAKVEMPTGVTGPVPAVVVLGGFADTATIKAEGVAVINYDPYLVGAESGSRSNKTGAFYTLYGNNSSTGLLAAWGWGVSRIIDVLEQSGTVLNPSSIGVTGCSRFGKGAFAVGVLDQRIALTMPFESGSGGVPIWRGIPGEGAQSPSSAYGETYWLGDAFNTYVSDVKRLPVDTHQLVAMVAPRGLFIMDNPHIANLGPKSAHVAALAGAEVYKALGAGNAISYHSNVASGSHCENRPEHKPLLQANIRRFLKKETATTGVINAHSKATGNLTEWIDWTTPALSN